MKFLILLCLLLNLGTAIAAPGFFNPNDPKLPAQLKTASNSVFEVRTAFMEDFDNYSDVDVVDIQTMGEANALSAIDQLNVDAKDKQIYKAFIKLCKSQNKVQECPIPRKLNSGTGFITGNGSKLWTNAHVLEKVLKTKAVTNDKSLQTVLSESATAPIFIFDKNGNMIFNGLEQAVSYTAIPRQTQLAQAQNSFYSIDSDAIAIQLPKSIGTPLKVAKQLYSDDVAVIGYPVCTGCDAPEGMDGLEFIDRYPYQNAEDCVEKVTGGKLITPESWADLAQVHQSILQTLDKSSFIAHTADSQYGMSGGPMLNFNGEVIGIHAGGKSIQGQDGVKRYSRGVRPPELFKEP